ncbi:hypothetical protein JIQ42_03855 [Leishmania sp. Namibia]|uniref:hypothetical protein n=1 Tax=Leishmania sp. Namibia TaxID=2802991 RepID=UPI001B6A0331|nr:hypothetical protein JIQ42_03855 [Leishmania sp. Namibia]
MMSPEDATGLEAARKQKIHNLRLKTACLENEELVQELHISDWSETQRQKLRGAHEKGEELLASVEVGTKWNLMEAYDLAKLMRVCGLEMSQRELYRPEDKPQFMDIIAVKKVLQDLRQNRNKTRIVSFTQLIDNSIARVEKVEEELRRSQLDATQLAQVPSRTLKMMEDIMNATQIQNALASTEDQMKTQLAQLEKTNEIQNVAMHDGEMQVAEEQMWTKVQLQERLIELLKEKFGLIGKCEEENARFQEIYEVQKQANQETSQMKDAKRRLRQRCETDLKHIQDAIQKADLEDAEATKRYAGNKERSERAIKENEEMQEDAWNKIQDLERQLQNLGTDRFDEVKRRIEEVDREEKRRVENAQFLEIAAQHKKLLELTVYNCDLAVRCTGLVEELVSEGCAGVKARYDKTNQELAALRLEVHKEHLEYFRMLYLTLGSLIYKKEKRLEEIDRNIRLAHIQLEFCVETFDPNAKKHADMKKDLYKLRQGVEEELVMLKEKQAAALDDFKESEEALDAAGIEFNHPVDENNEEVLTRRSKMVEYKSHLTKQEEVKIAAEREEIKRARLLRSGGESAAAQITNGSMHADGAPNAQLEFAAAGGAQGAPGVLPHAVPDAGVADLQEGEASGGDRPEHPPCAHPAGVLRGDVRPEREEARGHEEGSVQAAAGCGGGACDAEGKAGCRARRFQGVGGGAGRRGHRIQPPGGREQRGGADASQQDGGVQVAPDEAGGGEDRGGARGDQARAPAAQRRRECCGADHEWLHARRRRAERAAGVVRRGGGGVR